MNVLLVDDDRYAIMALQQKIDWVGLGVGQVFTANNIHQARELLGRHPIAILLCDIEMPQGSGLELLAWIRQENLSIQAIFMTNYADFNYAQKAIELQSLDYFLKPVEFDKLTVILKKAVVRARQETGESAASMAMPEPAAPPESNDAELYYPPNLPQLEKYLSDRRPDLFMLKMESYLDAVQSRGAVGISFLRLLRHNIVQLAYSYMSRQGIQAHVILDNEEYDRRYEAAIHSGENMLLFLRYLSETVCGTSAEDDNVSVADRIKAYIGDNYGGDLSRNALAQVFYLHPDYLTRLFHQKTGQSLSSYITQVRMEQAKRLLEQSGLSIHEIAAAVGLPNYSHFSKVFKDMFHTNPNSYRKQARP